MSSTYRILCLTHDPAIIIDTPDDWNRPEPAEEAIQAGLAEHPHCDLVIGRYSYPLVELGCPATRDQPANLPCCHGSTQWTGKDWLLLLAAAYQSDDPAVRQAVKDGGHYCLPPERLNRLRHELGITDTPSPPSAPTPPQPITCNATWRHPDTGNNTIHCTLTTAEGHRPGTDTDHLGPTVETEPDARWAWNDSVNEATPHRPSVGDRSGPNSRA